MDKNWKKASLAIRSGELAVIPTDTIYGIVAMASDKKAVDTLYRVRGRDPKKPCIVLCAFVDDLPKLGIKISAGDKLLLSKIWPNPVSVILPCPDKRLSYLHKGTNALAIRIPRNRQLIKFIKITGPIIAPSANPEGKTPAKSIKEAKNYFGDKVGVYVSGRISEKASTLIRLTNGKIEMVRQGTFKVSKKLIDGIQ